MTAGHRRGHRRLQAQLRQPRARAGRAARRRSPTCSSTARSGIAVGMATNLAPHNLVEVVQALRHLINHPKATLDDLMRFVPGPDLPTGGKIVGLDGIREAYETGRGSFRMRASARIENVTPRRKGIVVTELPVQRRPRAGDRTDQDAGPDQEAAGHRRRQGPHRPQQGPPAGHRDQERLPPRGDPRAALPADPDGGVVRHQRRRARRRPAAHAGPASRCSRSTSTTASTSCAAGAAFRRTKAQERLHLVEGLLIAILDIDEVIQLIRSSDNAEQATQPADDGLRPVRDPGQLHPRHAAAPADQVLASSSWSARRPSSSGRSRS